MAVLEMYGITKHFGAGQARVQALDGVNLVVEPGEFVAVMGPSGCGKSTLLGIAGGLQQPDSGEVVVEGSSLHGLDPDALAAIRRRSVGIVHQDYNLVPSLTARENVRLPLDLDGVKASEAGAAADRALEAVGMTAVAGRYLDELSGGQRQRVAVARGIVGSRRLVLADEPTGALDSTTGDEVVELLRDLADSGVAVVLVTHDARHAGWADRVVFLRDGREVDRTSAVTDAREAMARVSATLQADAERDDDPEPAPGEDHAVRPAAGGATRAEARR